MGIGVLFSAIPAPEYHRLYKDGTVLDVTYIVGSQDVPGNVQDGVARMDASVGVGQGGHALGPRIQETHGIPRRTVRGFVAADGLADGGAFV